MNQKSWYIFPPTTPQCPINQESRACSSCATSTATDLCRVETKTSPFPVSVVTHQYSSASKQWLDETGTALANSPAALPSAASTWTAVIILGLVNIHMSFAESIYTNTTSSSVKLWCNNEDKMQFILHHRCRHILFSQQVQHCLRWFLPPFCFSLLPHVEKVICSHHPAMFHLPKAQRVHLLFGETTASALMTGKMLSSHSPTHTLAALGYLNGKIE